MKKSQTAIIWTLFIAFAIPASYIVVYALNHQVTTDQDRQNILTLRNMPSLLSNIQQ